LNILTDEDDYNKLHIWFKLSVMF